MDQGAPLKQPSNTVIFATALACAAAILWAYGDQSQRVDGRESSQDRRPIEVLPAPAMARESALTFKPNLNSPGEALTRQGSEAASSVPKPAARAFVTAVTPRRLPTPPEPTPAPLSTKPADVPDDDASEEDAAEDYWAYDPYYEPLCETPTPANPITPEELWTEEHSVLAADDEPFVYLDQDAWYVASLPQEELLTYTPLAAEISQQVTRDVQAAFSLGRHGALHAARLRFLQVMRQIATAKDVAAQTDHYSESLDAGLTALAEARDYLPGGAVTKDLTVPEVAVSHLTPILHDKHRAERTLPHQAAALYYRYAEQKLAAAVQGEQAGSMALYGLGKTHAQLAQLEGTQIDKQKTLVMHHAALLAHGGNYLAANELGVGLAQAGRYQKAAGVLQHSIANGGGSTVYRNLAFVQGKLGQPRFAAVTTQQAEQLASRERAAGQFSRERGVEWVSPDRLASTATHASQPGQSSVARSPAPAAPPEPAGPVSRVARFAKRMVRGEPQPKQPQPYTGPVRDQRTNYTASPVQSQTTIIR